MSGENGGERNKEPNADHTNVTDSRTPQATTVCEDSANLEIIAPTHTNERNVAPFLGDPENKIANS